MPELPEVQTVLDAILPLVQGHRIAGVTALWPGVIAQPAWGEFVRWLTGRCVVHGDRRGKYLLFALDEPPADGWQAGRWLVMHLRMTGEMRCVPAGDTLHRHDRLIFHLANGEDWRFKDQRKFGRAYLVDDVREVIGKLGPEPLSAAFDTASLGHWLAGRTAPLKSLLLDQRIVAGIGNIYADEALFRARLHPLRAGGSLQPAELATLVWAVRAVLRESLAAMGTTLRDYRRPDGSLGEFQNQLQVFQRTGQPCLRCGAPIRRIVVGGRSTHFCPNEQGMGDDVGHTTPPSA